MTSDAHDPIQQEADADLAQVTEAAWRKRAAPDWLDNPVEKRPRHHQSASKGPLEQSDVEASREIYRNKSNSAVTEDEIQLRCLEEEGAAMDEYKISNLYPAHSSDPGYDQFYGYSSRSFRQRLVVEEPKSYIICDSPQEALRYFKTNEKEVRRRIKHIIFSPNAVAFGISRNGLYWKGLCNYMQKYMCIESIMVPVPYDPVSAHIQYESLEADDLMEETTEDRMAVESLLVHPEATFPPPQLSPSEASVLEKRRRAFDWKILSYLSQALVSGFLKELRLNYPVSFAHPITAEFKALKAIHEHTQEFAREKRKTALQAGRVDPERVRAQYAFNLTKREGASGKSTCVVALSKLYSTRQFQPRLSLLGLPREIRDSILHWAISTNRSNSLYIVDCALDDGQKRIQLKPFSNVYSALRLVSRQIQLESSPFLFRDKTLVLACTAKQAYGYLIRLPSDALKHIKIIRLHELILNGRYEGNRHAWPQLAEFIARQIPLQELVLHVPNDPNFHGLPSNKGETITQGDGEEEEDADEVERRKNQRRRTILKSWIEYWWPGARLVMQLLLQKRIAKCIKLRHGAKDYLQRSGLPAKHQLHELEVVNELGFPYDSRLDRSFRQQFSIGTLDYLLQFNQFIGENAEFKRCYEKEIMEHSKRWRLEFHTSMGTDGDGYQVVVITRK